MHVRILQQFHDNACVYVLCLQPLDRDQPVGRPQWRFTVFAQDEGGEGLVGYADVQVNLKDINDNAPIFPQGIYFGNVTENGTAGKLFYNTQSQICALYTLAPFQR